MIEDQSAQDVVKLYGAILKTRDHVLTHESVILDFGCGTGRHTYEYVDAGFRSAFGYDVKNYIDLRSPTDLKHFRFDQRTADGSEYPSMTKIPWSNNTFDFVFATSVFEHVADQELAYSEIHRVLKPGGLFLNIFPSKWRPIEGHINVPFGGVFKSRRYLRLCAALGIRGANQEAFTAGQVLELNCQFLTYGVNYLTGRQIAGVLDRTFDEFEYVEDAFITYSPGRSRYLAIPLKFLPFLRELYRFAHTRVILARKSARQA